MQRIFTKTTGNFEKGAIKEYPPSTWKQIEKSAGTSIDTFTKLVEDAATEGINTFVPEELNLTLRKRVLRPSNTT